MVRVRAAATPVTTVDAGLVAVGVWQGADPKRRPRGADAWWPAYAELAALGDFRGKFKETRVVLARGALKAPRILLVGLGKSKEFRLDSMREVGARVVLAARDLRVAKAAVVAPTSPGIPPKDAARALAEGARMALFEYREHKKDPKDGEEPRVAVEELIVLAPTAAAARALEPSLREAEIVADSVNLARTLIMRPSLEKPPEVYAGIIRDEAKKAGVGCTVLAPAELRRLGCNALLGVGSGSARPPRMVLLEYRGRGKRRVLLAGKGITFDSGGISIKPAEGMEKMKYDMAGSAAVLGTVLAAARLRLPVHVLGVLALAENMPSGSAIRPGDVLVAYNKKAIEVANTDAEGRLVLADALSYGVATFKPDVAVDVATLTGAVRVALGGITTAVLGTDRVARSLIEAGKRTGDDLWQLPLSTAYERQVTSEIADVKNVGVGGFAGCIAGAAFLKAFVGDTPWAHLDIAGTAWTEKGPAELQKEYLPKGATAMGVRLLTEWLRRA